MLKVFRRRLCQQIESKKLQNASNLMQINAIKSPEPSLCGGWQVTVLLNKGGDNLLLPRHLSLPFNFILLPSGVNLSAITQTERHVPFLVAEKVERGTYHPTRYSFNRFDCVVQGMITKSKCYDRVRVFA